MNEYLIVALAGAVGALSRWGLGKFVHSLMGNGFPYGTLIVNILGCFLIGLIMHIGLTTSRISETTRIGLTVGFVGALTTFSSFSYETLILAEQGRWMGVCSNIVLNIILGLLATMAGLSLAKALFGGTA